MSENFVGEIRLIAGTYAPKNWALCQGQILQIRSNTALFALLGVTYGGDGKTTFGLPDLRGRVPVCLGQSPGQSNYNLGQVGGEVSHALTTNEAPTHTHSFNGDTQAASTGSPGNNLLGAGVGRFGTKLFGSSGSPSGPMAGNAVSSVGQGQAHENMQPYLVMNYCIALVGVFPQRP